MNEESAGGALTDEEHALLVTGLIALGLPEAWELIDKLDEGRMFWVRSADQAEQ